MRRFVGFWVGVAFILSGIPDTSGREMGPELEIKSQYRLEKEPLTTEKVWKLDAQQTNPHRQRWVLSRHVEVSGVKTIPRPGNQLGVQASGILSLAQGYLRPSGVWFQKESEFTCEKSPNSWFQTEEGARRALSVAAEVWSDFLKERRDQLQILLNRVIAETESSVLDSANRTFRFWLRELEADWRPLAQKKAREAEWKYYWEEAKKNGLCTGGKNEIKANPPSWESLMEPLDGTPPKVTQLLARAPAKLWNGFFTVRLTLSIGGKNLNGRFLLDSGATASTISPSWLEGQGIQPVFILIPREPAERVDWSMPWVQESHLARRALVENVELAGLRVPLQEFFLVESEFFTPPEFVGTCCDGVLGTDFLRQFPIEFQSEVPAEIRVWPKEGFQWSADTPWLELSEASAGNFVSSSCAVVANKTQVPVIRWGTASENSLEVHSSWQNQLRKSGKSVKIQCDGKEFADSVVPSFPQARSSMSKAGGATAGIPILARGNFTLDLPHGRIWFTQESLKKEPILYKNQSGLHVSYVSRKGDRRLEVKRIDPGSSAQKLAKEGLRPGVELVKLDDKDPSDLDYWEVQKRLAGAYGEVVSIQWETPQGLKIAPLYLKKK